jgi:hypothetical protein
MGRDQVLGGFKQTATSKLCINRCDIKRLFHLPQQRAAQMLGVSLSKLKSMCRKLGVARWPYTRRSYVRVDRLCTSPPPPRLTSWTSDAPYSVKLEGGGDADGVAVLPWHHVDINNQDQSRSTVLNRGHEQSSFRPLVRAYSDVRTLACSSRSVLDAAADSASEPAGAGEGGVAQRRVASVPNMLSHLSQETLDLVVRLQHHLKPLHPRWAENPSLVTWGLLSN